MGTLLLFSLVIGYVYIYGYGYQGTTQQQVILFILLALGTVALSGISDGRKIGLMSWFFIACLLLICILFIWQWTTPFWVIFTTALWLHSLLMLLGIGRNPYRCVMSPEQLRPLGYQHRHDRVPKALNKAAKHYLQQRADHRFADLRFYLKACF